LITSGTPYPLHLWGERGYPLPIPFPDCTYFEEFLIFFTYSFRTSAISRGTRADDGGRSGNRLPIVAILAAVSRLFKKHHRTKKIFYGSSCDRGSLQSEKMSMFHHFKHYLYFLKLGVMFIKSRYMLQCTNKARSSIITMPGTLFQKLEQGSHAPKTNITVARVHAVGIFIVRMGVKEHVNKIFPGYDLKQKRTALHDPARAEGIRYGKKTAHNPNHP
jgi:hypothetical protein